MSVPLPLIAPPAWMSRARCAAADPDVFFPEKGGSVKAAKAICAGCPVAGECLQWALEHGEQHGVWGGKSERERRRLRMDKAALRTPEAQRSPYLVRVRRADGRCRCPGCGAWKPALAYDPARAVCRRCAAGTASQAVRA